MSGLPTGCTRIVTEMSCFGYIDICIYNAIICLEQFLFCKISNMIYSTSVKRNDQKYKFSTEPIPFGEMTEISMSLVKALMLEFGEQIDIFASKTVIIKDKELGFLRVKLASYEEGYIKSSETCDDLRREFSLHVQWLDPTEVPTEEDSETFFVSLEK